ncbi:MAG: hypothetical protein ACJAS9_002515 [Polaribacter sp.]|jgi:hypothetical protein
MQKRLFTLATVRLKPSLDFNHIEKIMARSVYCWAYCLSRDKGNHQCESLSLDGLVKADWKLSGCSSAVDSIHNVNFGVAPAILISQ